MTRDRGWLIQQYDSVASTMDQARLLTVFGAPDRTVVVSAEQTAGRGRGGRSWQSPAGTAVFCTMVLRPAVTPDRLSTLPLVAGVAVAEAIELVTGCAVQLKWPNDVWLGADPDNAKVAGILVTSSLRGNAVDHALVGIGINVLAKPEDLPPGATSVSAATGLVATPDQVFNVLLDRFEDAYADYVAAEGRPSLDGWRARAALVGESVIVQDADRQLAGTFAGIDEDGGLLIEEPGRPIRKVVAGNLVRGPRSIR